MLKGWSATVALSFAHPVLPQNVTLVNAAGKTTPRPPYAEQG